MTAFILNYWPICLGCWGGAACLLGMLIVAIIGDRRDRREF